MIVVMAENTHLRFDWFGFDQTSKSDAKLNAMQVNTNKINRRSAV